MSVSEPVPRRPTSPPAQAATAPWSAVDVIRSAIWIGIIAGLLEGAVIKIGARLLHLPAGGLTPAELFWIAPLAATGCLLAVALVLLLIDLPLRRAVGRRLTTYALPIFIAIAFYSFVRSLRLGIAAVAGVVLAVGVATVVARLLAKRSDRTRRLIRRSLPWMVAALVAYAIAIPVWRNIAERRTLAALPAPAADRPNVLIVVLDAVRRFDVSTYGYERPTTPALTRFAARGTVFERAFATSPWSLPSHASILTGRYPNEMTTGHRQALDGSQLLLSEALAHQGYATGGFVGNLYYLQADFGMARGFTTYDARPQLRPSGVLSTWWLGKATYESFAKWQGNHQELLYRPAGDVNDALISWIGRRGPRPFFAFVNLFDAHEPYRPPAPFDTLFSDGTPLYWHDELPRPYSPAELHELQAAYDAGIRYMDGQLARLLERLRQTGELDRTIVIVTADHGEEFGEHDPSLVAHSMTLNTTSTLIPLVVVYPPRMPAKLRLTMPVSLRDLPATVMDLAGITSNPPFPGVSLAAYVDSTRREAPTPRVMMVEKSRKGNLPKWTANNGNLFSVVDGDQQYILDALQQEHLYDLSSDIRETHDLAARPEMADRLKRMRFLLDSLVAGPDGKLRVRAPSKARAFGQGSTFLRK